MFSNAKIIFKWSHYIAIRMLERSIFLAKGSVVFWCAIAINK